MATTDHAEGTGGLDRRSVLRRGAMLGGALVWTAPAVQTIAGPAFATGSPLCDAVLISRITQTKKGVTTCTKTTKTFQEDVACCDCVNGSQDDHPVALALCGKAGSCRVVSTVVTTC